MLYRMAPSPITLSDLVGHNRLRETFFRSRILENVALIS